MEERTGDNLNGKNLTGTSVLVLAGPGTWAAQAVSTSHCTLAARTVSELIRLWLRRIGLGHNHPSLAFYDTSKFFLDWIESSLGCKAKHPAGLHPSDNNNNAVRISYRRQGRARSVVWKHHWLSGAGNIGTEEWAESEVTLLLCQPDAAAAWVIV